MRRFVQAACAAALGIAVSISYGAVAMTSAPALAAASPRAASIIVVWPGQSIQAAVDHARPGDTVVVKPGVCHQGVLIRKNGITRFVANQLR
jgi:pectin methylesterase-like acyl-CoA thioesterase